MLGGLNQDALAHEAGGVADPGHVATGGGNLKVVQIGAAEDDARAGRSGQQAQGNGRAGVQPHSGELKWCDDRLFQVGGIGQKVPLRRWKNRTQSSG